jgi:hypothetical protein
MTDILRETPNIDLPAHANAPFVYFNSGTSFGVLNAVVQVNLEASAAQLVSDSRLVRRGLRRRFRSLPGLSLVLQT